MSATGFKGRHTSMECQMAFSKVRLKKCVCCVAPPRNGTDAFDAAELPGLPACDNTCSETDGVCASIAGNVAELRGKF